MEEQDLTKGPIRAQLWSLAWPTMLSVFFYTLYNLVDTYWVSKVSPEAIAAVSISQITLFVMIALGFGITIGSGVIMSMDIGARKLKEAERVLGQSFVLAAIAGIFFSAIAIAFREQFLLASGASGAIFAPALEYFTITAAGSVLFFILITIMFAFNSQGDTFTLTKLFALSTLINLVLDPILIFGWGGIPALGVGGAAYATLASQAVFIVIAIRSLSSHHRHIRFHFRNLTINLKSVKKVLIVGVPASFTQVIAPVGMAMLTYIVSLGYHEPGAIAFSLGFRAEFFAFLPAVGFGFASMAMIGQNIGAGKVARAREAFGTALRYSFFSATAIGVLIALFARPIIAAFTTDAAVTEYALAYLWTVSLSYGFLAAMNVEANAFQAIGRSWPGFWIFLIRFAGVSIPLAYLLSAVYHAPIAAVWGALIAGNIISALIGYVWIQKSMRSIGTHTTIVHK